MLAAVSCRPKPQDPPVAPPEPEAPPIGFQAGDFAADTLQIRSGETFSGLMHRLGMASQDAYALSVLCDSVFDVRKLRAGAEVQAYYAPDTTRALKYVVYVQDKVRSTVFRCADSLAVWHYDKPVEHERRTADVTITSSLWNDMMAAGATPNLIMELADIYQWSVNFFALQGGDRFRMIYDQTLCEGEVVSIDTVHFCLFTPESGREVAAVRFRTEDGAAYWDKGGESLKRMFLKAFLLCAQASGDRGRAAPHRRGLCRPDRHARARHRRRYRDEMRLGRRWRREPHPHQARPRLRDELHAPVEVRAGHQSGLARVAGRPDRLRGRHRLDTALLADFNRLYDHYMAEISGLQPADSTE